MKLYLIWFPRLLNISVGSQGIKMSKKFIKILCKFAILNWKPTEKNVIQLLHTFCNCNLLVTVYPYSDIDHDIDEKDSARVLEQATATIGISCVFTVVSNAFTALEFTETTCIDIIFISSDLEYLTAESFLHILRNVGAPMYVVLLVSERDPISEVEVKRGGFYSLLRKGYHVTQLCSIITDIILDKDAN